MFRKLLAAAAMMLTMLLAPGAASAAECTLYEQSHPMWPLSGAHLSTGKCSTCASCHKAGVFVGTPRQCTTCHTGAALFVPHHDGVHGCQDGPHGSHSTTLRYLPQRNVHKSRCFEEVEQPHPNNC
jgi:hypothetical protein